MNRADQLKLIAKAYDALPGMGSHGFYSQKEKLYDMNMESERRHRKGAPSGFTHGITKDEAARLFVVKWIADEIRKPSRYDVTAVLSIRAECLHAAALAQLYRKDIRAAWKRAGITLDDLEQLNYADLNHGRAV